MTILHLCFGCDANLGAPGFCASCGEDMPTYEWPEGETAVYARGPSRIEVLLAARSGGVDQRRDDRCAA